MRARKSISRFAQLVRTNVGPVSGIASAYRAISLTALAWLVALEAYRFANKTYKPDIDTHEATKGQATDRPGSPAPDARENGPSIAGAQAERHAKVDGSPALGSQHKLLTAPKSDRRPIRRSSQACCLPVRRLWKVVTTTSPVSGIDLKSNPASIVLAGNEPERFCARCTSGAGARPVTIAPTVSSVAASGSGIDVNGNGDLNAGHVVTLTVTLSETVTVAGGVPTLVLNNGGTASYVGGSGTDTLTFSYTVAAGQDTSDLAVASFSLNGATVQGDSGDNADLSGVVTNPPGVLQIDTTAPLAPAIASIVPGGSGGNHWVLTGTAEPNSTVTIFDGATQLDTVTASGSGAWTYTTVGSGYGFQRPYLYGDCDRRCGKHQFASRNGSKARRATTYSRFGSEATLTAPAAISGNGGADTISMTAAVTLDDGDFAHVGGVQSLQLTGASTIALGANAASAGLVNVTTGSGATSITDSNGVTLNVDASALTAGQSLTLTGSSAATVTLNAGNLSAGSYAGISQSPAGRRPIRSRWAMAPIPLPAVAVPTYSPGAAAATPSTSARRLILAPRRPRRRGGQRHH